VITVIPDDGCGGLGGHGSYCDDDHDDIDINSNANISKITHETSTGASVGTDLYPHMPILCVASALDESASALATRVQPTRIPT